MKVFNVCKTLRRRFFSHSLLIFYLFFEASLIPIFLNYYNLGLSTRAPCIPSADSRQYAKVYLSYEHIFERCYLLSIGSHSSVIFFIISKLYYMLVGKPNYPCTVFSELYFFRGRTTVLYSHVQNQPEILKFCIVLLPSKEKSGITHIYLRTRIVKMRVSTCIGKMKLYAFTEILHFLEF